MYEDQAVSWLLCCVVCYIFVGVRLCHGCSVCVVCYIFVGVCEGQAVSWLLCLCVVCYIFVGVCEGQAVSWLLCLCGVLRFFPSLPGYMDNVVTHVCGCYGFVGVVYRAHQGLVFGQFQFFSAGWLYFKYSGLVDGGM